MGYRNDPAQPERGANRRQPVQSARVREPAAAASGGSRLSLRATSQPINEFVNFGKRSVELPPGCKDLIDVLRPPKRRPVLSTVTIREGQSLRRVSKQVRELLAEGTRPRNLVIAWGGTDYVHLINQKQVLSAMAVVHEKTGHEQSVRGAFSTAGLTPISDEVVAGGAIHVLHYSMSVSTTVVDRLIPDLLHNGYGLTRKSKYQLGYWEDENS